MPHLPLTYANCEEEGGAARESESLWKSAVGEIQASPDELEREHVWLGVHREHDYPVLCHRNILHEHAYMVGDSGSGKTALGMMPIVQQLIRARDGAVVIIDLKGDGALFQTARAEAAKSGATFKHFSNELGSLDSHLQPFRPGR